MIDEQQARTIAALRLAQLALDPLMQVTQLHSKEDERMRACLTAIQTEIDELYKKATYEIKAQMEGGLITVESYMHQCARFHEATQCYYIEKNLK